MSKLLNWRKSKPVIHTGKLLHFVPENDMYVFFRYNDTEKIMVIMNNNETEQLLTLDRYSEGLKNYSTGKDVISEQTFNMSSPINVPAQTALILELK